MRTSSNRRQSRAATGAVALLLALSACGHGSVAARSVLKANAGARPGAASTLRGTTPPAAYQIPDVTLTDQQGQPYPLKARTAGRDALVFFGYTHCPDECPAQMATLATALRQSPASIAAHDTVVFISSDPHRDTPARLATWLKAFGWPDGTQVVGLSGPFATVDTAARALDVPLLPPKVTSGNYEVTHGTQAIGFDRTGTAKALWLNGASPADVTHDLPLLDSAPAPTAPTADPHVFALALDLGALQLGNGAASTVGDGHAADVTFTVRNTTNQPDTLLGVSGPAGSSAALRGAPGQSRPAIVPGNGDLALSTQGLHVTLTGLTEPVSAGDSLPVTLQFERAGNITFVVPVTGQQQATPPAHH